ncbi:MAG: cobaltochelatase subunit CobN [Tissierellia bacterium]|nr:cobaltochelatase subunit CobN [Tissierellia bacterium]
MKKIGYYTATGGELILISNGFNNFLKRYNNLEIQARSKRDLRDLGKFSNFLDYIKTVDMLIISLHGGKESCPGFDELISSVSNNTKIFIYPSSASDLDIALEYSNLEEEIWKKLYGYFSYSGVDNYYNMLIYLNNILSHTNYEFEEPKPLPWEGIYHPDYIQPPTLDEYLEKKYDKTKPTIGIWFHRSQWVNQNTDYMDRLIQEIENRGANVLALFCNSIKDDEIGNLGAKGVTEEYFTKNNETLIDVLINMMMFSSTMMDKENEFMFHKLGVPVIKGILSFNNKEDWEKSFQGLDPIDISINIAMPEFDGNLITVPIAFNNMTLIDPLTGAKITRYIVEEERVEKIVNLSLNWAKLKYIPNSEKKVAIIFHNYPPKNHSIGTAFGLDSPTSVINILREMDKRGYSIEKIPGDGDELIGEIINRATNDRNFISNKELYKRAIDTVELEDYTNWINKLSNKVKEDMIKSFGSIPGEMFNYNNSLIIPGIINGNVFIGLQPPRGFSEDNVNIHSPDLPMPHHYYAYYEWIRNVFKADAIMHIGMHGSLEWLPGKSAGLSKDCYPDIAIGDLPNIYPYIINNPGEGTQAKRRSYCCIIDHMIPVMHNAGVYEETAELENQLEEYYEAKSVNPSKLPYLESVIWEKTLDANLHIDLGLSSDVEPLDFEKFIQELHGYLNELKDTQIRDGLHILGEPPSGELLIEFLVALTRLSNGEVPSLRQALAEYKGYSLNQLLDSRGALNSNGRTNAHIIDEIHELSLNLVSDFCNTGFNITEIDKICVKHLGEKNSNVEKVLMYIGDFLVPNINKTTEEIINAVNAIEGKFVPSGPSGSPTRGMAHILPTGRNFYSVDPKAIPSPAAWKVGVKLGDDLLNRYVKEEGKYPENIGIVIWGSPTMRTKGDDIAEVLYLMGIRPIWDKESGYVKNLEIIPLEELGRPRIDVTLRISGFFRDGFPNIVELLDRAVEMVGFLDEDNEKNYIKKHIEEDINNLVSRGKPINIAKEEASYRIFGCKPGTYGAGVCNLINSKKWEDITDLGQIYLDWGAYAYGKDNYGKSTPDSFKRRLSVLDIAVKNIDHRERGMLDSDDFYSYHGGMIAAVKTFKGEAPKAFIGDSSEIERIKTRTVDEEARHEFRARVFNPKWIESMKKHGYKGAGDIANTVNHAFGWHATADAIDNWIYDDIYNKFLLDKDFSDWMKEVNPWARHEISERLLEAIQREMWDASDEMKENIRKIYLETEGDIEEYGDR